MNILICVLCQKEMGISIFDSISSDNAPFICMDCHEKEEKIK